jgi:hypothetical protein
LPGDESSAEQAGLAAAFVGQRRVELALDAMLAIPSRLAVANEN